MKKLLIAIISIVALCALVLTGCDDTTSSPTPTPPSHVHSGTFVEAVPATCSTEGVKAHYACSCEMVFADEACTVEATDLITAFDTDNHVDVRYVSETPATCITRALSPHYECVDCERLFQDASATVEVWASDLAFGEYGDHANVVFAPASAPLCTGEPGILAHYYCVDCSTTALDQDMEYIVDEHQLRDYSPNYEHVGDLYFHLGAEPTCMTSGMADYYECCYCWRKYLDEDGTQEVFSEYDLMLPPSAHDTTYYEAVLPTCTNGYLGSMEYWHCFACGENFSDSDGFNPIHNTEFYGNVEDINCHNLEFIDQVKTTCVTDGNAAYYDCKDCNLYFDEYGYLYYETSSFYMGYERNEYSHNLLYMPAKNASCLDGNVECYHCEYCDTYYDPFVDIFCPMPEYIIPKSQAVISANGMHDMISHEYIAPTCNEPGRSAYWECDVCDKFFWDEGGLTERLPDSLVIPATGHSWTHYDETQSTCTTQGNIMYSHCNKCNRDYNLLVSPAEDVTGNVLKPLAPHQTKLVSGTPATCTEDGVKESRYCTVCETHFEADLVTKITDLVIPATGHSYHDEWVTTADGHFRPVSCGHDVEPELEEHNALGYRIHTESTCTVEGFAEIYCTVCDYVINYETLPLKDHDFTLVPATDSDCKNYGYDAHYTCSTCVFWFDENHEEKSAILFRKPLDYSKHDYDYVTTEPTCETEGLKVGTCNICNGTTEIVLNTVDHRYEYLEKDEYYHRLTCIWCKTLVDISPDTIYRSPPKDRLSTNRAGHQGLSKLICEF